jgi:hypothetical protein
MSLVKRSTEPVVTVFRREPSLIRGTSQISLRRHTAGTCGLDVPLLGIVGGTLMGAKRMKSAAARELQ